MARFEETHSITRGYSYFYHLSRRQILFMWKIHWESSNNKCISVLFYQGRSKKVVLNTKWFSIIIYGKGNNGTSNKNSGEYTKHISILIFYRNLNIL